MARLFPMLYFALLVLVVPVEAVGQSGQLAKMSSVTIEVNLNPTTEELGIIKDEIKNHILVFLRSKLPRLAVKESGYPSLEVAIQLQLLNIGGQNEEVGYHGVVVGYVKDYVSHLTTKKVIFATLWTNGFTSSGLSNSASTNVNQVLDRLLTDLAADWYRDNP